MSTYMTLKVVDAEIMSATEAKEKGYKVGEADNNAVGFEVIYSDGYKSWCPYNTFVENSIELESTAVINFTELNHLPEFLQRMIAEYLSLDSKLIKLNKMIDSPKFETLPSKTKKLMKLQLKAMVAYHSVLNARIKVEYDNVNCGVK